MHGTAKLKAAAQLMRWHSPFGALLLFAPCAWGLALAHASFSWYLLFAVGAWFLRSFGCVLNDMADIHIDSLTPRTSQRPLANSTMTQREAFVCALLCLCVGGCVWLYLPSLAKIWSLVGLALACVYPFTKRFFFAPQFILGITFNIGTVVAYAAVTQTYTPSVGWLWASSVWWTVAYDTVYAYHDAPFDAELGYFSTAHYAHQSPYLFVGVCLALHVTLLTAVLPLFLCITYGLGALLLLNTWKPSYPPSAFRFFQWNLLLALILWLLLSNIV